MRLPGFKLGSLSQDDADKASSQANKLQDEDRLVHDWYRFVLSFPPHLVRDYLQDFGLGVGHTVLDPFCGTGTTLVEAKLNGIQAFGLESNPFPHFASSVKVNWRVEPDELLAGAHRVADAAWEQLQKHGIDDRQPFGGDIAKISLKRLGPEAMKLLIKNSISPLPLHKTLILLEHLNKHSSEEWYNHALLALGNALVKVIGNLNFGPEVGVGKLKKDVPVVLAWLSEVTKIASDLRVVAKREQPDCHVQLADARAISQVLAPQSIDGVITSPPYPNEKDYTRTTRLESVVLGFMNSRAELQAFKKTLVRSNTRGVYKEDDDDRWVVRHQEIQRIADAIEQRRIDLGKTSGFERMYGRVTRLYFGGMARHLAELGRILRPGAQLAYVVGDQASYLRVMIRTGQLLAEIAQELGYELVRIDLFRTRFATATKDVFWLEIGDQAVVTLPST